jgi:hypothetical protein
MPRTHCSESARKAQPRLELNRSNIGSWKLSIGIKETWTGSLLLTHLD